MKVALLDIGTNSVRYLAASIQPFKEAAIIARGLAAPRLGEGVVRSGNLTEKAIRRTLGELELIRNSLKAAGADQFICVGTEALRMAANGGEFIGRAKELGLEVKVLKGEEEAELIYRGATAHLLTGKKENILVDIGGGSTEIIIKTGESEQPLYRSIALGCVRLKEEFQKKKQPEINTWQKMKDYCRNLLQKEWPRPSRRLPLVGLGGTITTLAAIHLKLPSYRGEKVHGLVLNRDAIEDLFQKLLPLPPEERKKVVGLEPERADIIIPGTIITQAVMEHIGATRVTVSDRGLLFGLLQKFIAGLKPEISPPSPLI